MSKKKEAKKSLQKRVTAIVEIYMEQKSKNKKKLMKDFIEIKVNEIIEFSEQLETKKQKKKNESPAAEPIIIPETPNLQPSLELVAALQNNHTVNTEIKNETTLG